MTDLCGLYIWGEQSKSLQGLCFLAFRQKSKDAFLSTPGLVATLAATLAIFFLPKSAQESFYVEKPPI